MYEKRPTRGEALPKRTAGQANDPEPASGPTSLVPSNTENGDAGRLLAVVTYTEGKLTKECIHEDEVRSMEPSNFSFFWNRVHGIIVVHRSNGLVGFHRGKVQGVGMVKFALLRKLLRHPGRYLYPSEIGNMKPEIDSHFIRDSLVGMVAVLRKHLFQESADNAEFILTTAPFRTAWSGDKSFRVIEWPDGEPQEED